MLGSPNMMDSASSPPIPQPKTPSALIMGVWLSLPRHVSGINSDGSSALVPTTVPKYSRFTWCMMPPPGGMTRRLLNRDSHALINAKRSALISNSRAVFRSRASGWLQNSTLIEWSITRSTGRPMSISDGATPERTSAERIAIRSTRIGKPSMSWRRSREGLNATA